MCVRVKLSFKDLNPDPYPPHPTNTYMCRVTIVPKMCGGIVSLFKQHNMYFYNTIKVFDSVF